MMEQATPDQEVSDGAGRIVAGRFRTVHEADLVLGRLRGLGLGAMLQERSELSSDDAHLWLWVPADDLERARTCMRPGDVLGEARTSDRRGSAGAKRSWLPWSKG